jgi:thioredoxin reductase (NADPH)
MAHRVNNTPNIEVKYNHELIGIEGENFLVETAVTINNQTQEILKIPVHGIFIAIGHKPNTEIFTGQINLDENGYIKTVSGSSQTNLPGVFAAGDVQDNTYRQAITAAASGCIAAIDAEKYLTEL